ncbi:hypothetical protein [Paenibacillus mesophilus]|nr:hypothetical protein [Paenibacillus mesophilus]
MNLQREAEAPACNRKLHRTNHPFNESFHATEARSVLSYYYLND